MIEFENTFDKAAADYDESRPGYPAELYRDIFRCKPLSSKSRALEIGMGTGKATGPFLKTGADFIGIEPGESLAKLALDRFKNYSNFSLFTGAFQDFDCPDNSFDLIYAATAFHWIPRDYGYSRVFSLLKPGGMFARFAYHAGADKRREELARKIQKLYSEHMDSKNSPSEFSLYDAEKIAKKAEEYGFVDTKCHIYSATKDFTAKEYMALLRTYPDHMKLEKQKREKLFHGIYSAINNYGGLITVHYTIDLEMARKPG